MISGSILSTFSGSVYNAGMNGSGSECVGLRRVAAKYDRVGWVRVGLGVKTILLLPLIKV